jgi:hypothetical protein
MKLSRYEFLFLYLKYKYPQYVNTNLEMWVQIVKSLANHKVPSDRAIWLPENIN